jgi:hypothetical protein
LFEIARALALLGIVVAGCLKAPPPEPGPKAAAQAYLAALKAGDYQTCYRMMVENDLIHGSLDGFLGQIPMSPNVERRWFGQIEAATEYRIGSVIERGEAIVLIDVTTPNLTLWERMLAARNDTPQAVQAKAEKQLADSNYPRLCYPDQIVMVHEGGEWRILAGFAQRARLERLHSKALAAYHQLEYDKALELYDQMLQRLAKAPFTASGALASQLGRERRSVEAARNGEFAARSYLPNVLLRNLEANQATSGEPGMFGQLVNTGDRSLDEVEVTVSYYSDAGKLVYSERHTPVALPMEFTDFDLPMVPFGPGETRQLGIKLKAPLDVQEQNKPQMRVTGVLFTIPLAAPPKLAASGHEPTRMNAAPESATAPSEAAMRTRMTPAKFTPAPSAVPTAKAGSGANPQNQEAGAEEGSSSKSRKHKTRRHHRSSESP